MRVNEWEVLSRAVEEGIQAGIKRAYKHTDDPSEEELYCSIDNAVMGAICEVFKFEEVDV